MRNLKYLSLILIICLNLSILPAKAEEVLKPSELPAKDLVEEGNRKNELHDHEGAIADYKAALKIKPDYARAYFNLGVAACNIGDPHGEIFYCPKHASPKLCTLVQGFSCYTLLKIETHNADS